MRNQTVFPVPPRAWWLATWVRWVAGAVTGVGLTVLGVILDWSQGSLIAAGAAVMVFWICPRAK